MDAEIKRHGNAENQGDLPCSPAPRPPCSASVFGQDLDTWRTWAIQQATSADISPEEVDWFLQGVTNLDSLALRLGNYRARSAIAARFSLDTLTTKWQQRIRDRVPVQYLVGEAPWRDFMLTVTPAVLIPRPETELMVDIVKDWVESSPLRAQLARGTWVDLGTGSGAIALGLARALPQARIVATDFSAEALAVARQNAERHQLTNRIEFRCGSWFDPLVDLKAQLAGLVSNPPYIPSAGVLALQPEVTCHEPHPALDGGADGLNDIRQLVQRAPDYLQTGALWLIETMAGQSQTVQELLRQQSSYCQPQSYSDLAGIQRFVGAERS